MEQGISCICLTYARVNFLEEAVESFLKQDYPQDRCELIIVNDYSLQTLVFDHPNIRIINVMTPFKTIGEKVQFAIDHSNFDIIVTWDDDDVALPNHLRNIDKFFVEGTNILHWAKGCFWNEPEITSINFLGNSGLVYSKQVIERIGGVPKENAGYDTTMHQKIHDLGGIVFAPPKEEDASWFYRWGFTSKACYHQSGMGTDIDERPNILVRHAEHIEALRRKGQIPTGLIELKPHWVYDYKQQLQDFLTLKLKHRAPRSK